MPTRQKQIEQSLRDILDTMLDDYHQNSILTFVYNEKTGHCTVVLDTYIGDNDVAAFTSP